MGSAEVGGEHSTVQCQLTRTRSSRTALWKAALRVWVGAGLTSWLSDTDSSDKRACQVFYCATFVAPVFATYS
jgi:hypothetical protein